ncbi:MAG TPA: alpha-amylase family glycosyl hydrolase, partial [Woeseiaceae bacterium]|nr:alpha-amylase family glycosyl hydrolase [Woeseiaceae bacterium]
MIHGEHVATLEPSVSHDGVSITRVERTGNTNYLFVYLDIAPDALPGEVQLVFDNAGKRLSRSFTLLRKNADPSHAAGFSSRDAVYLITPDRFANGKPQNDNVQGMADQADRSKPGGRHGGDIQGISDRLDYIRKMGFTAIWLNPLLENAMPSYSYHGYSTTDFYRVDPRYGSNEEYRELVARARSVGIGVIMDMIVNHSGSEHWWMADPPSDTWINFPHEYVETSHQHTTIQDPYVSQADLQKFADGWFVPTMPDLNQRDPLLADYLAQNALWWIEYLGLAGIRMDTYPYPDKDYMTEWTRRVMLEYPQFNVVGEEWNFNPAIVSYWQRGKANHDSYVSYLPSLMDFPLREVLRDSLLGEDRGGRSSWEPLYQVLGSDFLYPDPRALVVFADNHDMSRIYTQLGEDYDLFRMAMVYVLTIRGAPQIYYGTEILMTNPGTDDHGVIRSDFPGGWPGDEVNGFSGNGLSGQQVAAQQFLQHLLSWRRDKKVIHDGDLMHYSPVGPVYAYFRYDETAPETDTVMVVFNKGDEPVAIDTSRFVERIGNRTRAYDVLTQRRFTLGSSIVLDARSVQVLELQD